MISSSKKARRTSNPIRNIVDNLNPPQNHPKKLLNLALGDPTVHGNLHCPSVLVDSVRDLLSRGSANGYLASTGLPVAKRAIASYHSSPGYDVVDDDVIIASGCSGAIDLILSGLMDEGDNILVPKPGFPLYQVISESLGGSVKYYPLLAETGWLCDLDAMDRAVDSKTRAILINNPSNPCGSNFPEEHLTAIAAVARKHNLPIIADEIYENCVFTGKFFPMHLYSGDVPVISVGGLAKEFIVPGWRVGWLILHDKGTGRLSDYKTGVKSLTQITLGASSLLQAAVPRVLCAQRDSKDGVALRAYMDGYMAVLRANADLCVSQSELCPELKVIRPQGAMYTMIQVDVSALQDIADDADFARKLLTEENLFILPGQCFNMPNFVRLVICPPADTIVEAFDRLRIFCERHRKNEEKTTIDWVRDGERDMDSTSSQHVIKKRRSNNM